jgi:hypothetical protein
VFLLLQRKRRVSDGDVGGSSDGGGSNGVPQINPNQALQQVSNACAARTVGLSGLKLPTE